MGGEGGGGGAPRSAALRRARPRCGRRLVLGAAPETIAAGSTHAPAPGPPGPPPLTPAPPPPGAALAAAAGRGAAAAPTSERCPGEHNPRPTPCPHLAVLRGCDYPRASAARAPPERPGPHGDPQWAVGPPLAPQDSLSQFTGPGAGGGGERRDYISQQPPQGTPQRAGAAQAPPGRPKMAARWSSENVVVEFRDAQVGGPWGCRITAPRGQPPTGPWRAERGEVPARESSAATWGLSAAMAGVEAVWSRLRGDSALIHGALNF